MIVLGIETSCDETAAALVGADRTVLAERVLSQIADHRPYGGVVPEIAARSHLDHLDGLINETMTAAGLTYGVLDGVAATAGPGLIGGVMVGLMTGKAIAAAQNLPFAAINHLEGHALSPRLIADIDFPYLLLLVSGGHCQFVAVEGVGRYRRLGTTVDDAAGEAFDKVAKLLGLDYPGGPMIERLAEGGDAARFALPRPMAGRPGCDLSFSGLKTAVHYALEGVPDAVRRDPRLTADMAASFQAAIVEAIVDRGANAFAMFEARYPGETTLVAAGGVAANRALRQGLEGLAGERGWRLVVPPPALCTDNAAMIAWAGIERLTRGLSDDFTVPARPRWPLDQVRAQ